MARLSMQALFIFHLKAGVRVALRSFAILFSSILAWIMLDMSPGAVVAALSASLFARHPALADIMPAVAIAFLLPALAAPTLLHGLNGWIRHLAIRGADNRRGLVLALSMVQAPLALALMLLAVIAYHRGSSVGIPSLRLLLVLGAGVLASLPVKRRYITVAAALLTAVLVLDGNWAQLWLACALLGLAEEVSGPLRVPRRRRSWHAADTFLTYRIAWRALGWRVPAIITVALLPLGATELFLRNNELTPELAALAIRVGGLSAVVLILAGLADKLAERRPAWPLARSFPWSSAQRVTSDALLVGLLGLPPVFVIAFHSPGNAACILAMLPFLSFRAAGYIRLVPELTAGARRFLIEGAGLAALLGLFPWLSLFCLAMAPLALMAAIRSERALKVTRWSDLHHAALGDSLSWSDS
jgi:hypothetical protein